MSESAEIIVEIHGISSKSISISSNNNNCECDGNNEVVLPDVVNTRNVLNGANTANIANIVDVCLTDDNSETERGMRLVGDDAQADADAADSVESEDDTEDGIDDMPEDASHHTFTNNDSTLTANNESNSAEIVISDSTVISDTGTISVISETIVKTSIVDDQFVVDSRHQQLIDSTTDSLVIASKPQTCSDTVETSKSIQDNNDDSTLKSARIMTAQPKILKSLLKKCSSDSSESNGNSKSVKRVTFSETMMVFCDDWPQDMMPQVIALKSPTDFNLVEAQGYMFEPPAEYQDFLPFEPPPDYRDFIASSLSAYDNDLSINFIDDDDDNNDDNDDDNDNEEDSSVHKYSVKSSGNSHHNHQNYINEMSSKWESMILNNSECLEEEQIIGVLREDALLQAIGSHVSLPEEHLCQEDFPIHFHNSIVKETCESVHLAESELSDITSDDGIDESSPTGSQQDIASDSSITSQDTIILINTDNDDNNSSYIALNNIDLSDDLSSSEMPLKSQECCLIDNNSKKVVLNTSSTGGDDIDIVTILENRLNKENFDNNRKELNENNHVIVENELNNAKNNLNPSNSVTSNTNTNVNTNNNIGCESEEFAMNDRVMDVSDATDVAQLDARNEEQHKTCIDSQPTIAKVSDGEELSDKSNTRSMPDNTAKVLTLYSTCSACSNGSHTTTNAFKRNLMFYENMLSESNKIMESNAKTKFVLKQATCAPFIICSQTNTNPSIVVSNNRTDDNKCEKYVNDNNLLDSSSNKCAKNFSTGDNNTTNIIDNNTAVNHRNIKVNGEAIQMITHPPHPQQHLQHQTQRCLQPNHHNWPSDEFIIEYTSEPRTLVPSKRTASLSSFPNALAITNNNNNQQKVVINNANYMSLNRVSSDAQQQYRQYNSNNHPQQQHSACPHIVRYQYHQQRLQRPILTLNNPQNQQQFFLTRTQPFNRPQYPSPPNPNQCSYSPQPQPQSQPQPIQRSRSPIPPVHTHTQLQLQRSQQVLPSQQQSQQQQQQQPQRTVIRLSNSMSQTLPHPHKQPPPYDYHILQLHNNKFPHASEIRRRDGLNAYPHVLRQTPQPGSLPVPPVHPNSQTKQTLTKDELEQFVQQDMQRTERIKKRYSLSEDDDPSFGFSRRPSVRGIRPKYCSTTEIIKQMQTNSNVVSTGLQIVTNHLSWPATLNNPTNV